MTNDLKKTGKELEKNYRALIEDIFDNFSKYTDSEREQIENEFQHLNNLNVILEKYDKKSKMQEILNVISGWWNNATGKK